MHDNFQRMQCQPVWSLQLKVLINRGHTVNPVWNVCLDSRYTLVLVLLVSYDIFYQHNNPLCIKTRVFILINTTDSLIFTMGSYLNNKSKI